MFEFNQALTCQLDDPADFRIVIILMEPLESLRAPAWFVRYVRNHLYIRSNEVRFLNKIKQGLPAPSGHCVVYVSDGAAHDGGSAARPAPDAKAERDADDEEYDEINRRLHTNGHADCHPLLPE